MTSNLSRPEILQAITQRGTENNMASTGQEEQKEMEIWIRTQKLTFTNWVNDKLRGTGSSVTELTEDFKDGVTLCKLMNILQGKKIGRIIEKKRISHYEGAGNLALATQAMKNDGVKLVNIGE